MIPKTRLQSAYLFQRKKGLPPKDAKLKAEKMVEQLSQLKKQKRRGLTSKNAFEAIKQKQKFRQIQNILIKLNPTYRISLAEAATIEGMYLPLTSLMALKKYDLDHHQFHAEVQRIRENFSLRDFLGDYAAIRFRPDGIRFSSERNALRILSEIARRRKLQLDKTDLTNISLDFYFGGKTPELSSDNTRDFFERVKTERTEHISTNQQLGLALALNEALVLDTSKNNLNRLIRMEVKRLSMPPPT